MQLNIEAAEQSEDYSQHLQSEIVEDCGGELLLHRYPQLIALFGHL